MSASCTRSANGQVSLRVLLPTARARTPSPDAPCSIRCICYKVAIFLARFHSYASGGWTAGAGWKDQTWTRRSSMSLRTAPVKSKGTIPRAHRGRAGQRWCACPRANDNHAGIRWIFSACARAVRDYEQLNAVRAEAPDLDAFASLTAAEKIARLIDQTAAPLAKAQEAVRKRILKLLGGQSTTVVTGATYLTEQAQSALNTSEAAVKRHLEKWSFGNGTTMTDITFEKAVSIASSASFTWLRLKGRPANAEYTCRCTQCFGQRVLTLQRPLPEVGITPCTRASHGWTRDSPSANWPRTVWHRPSVTHDSDRTDFPKTIIFHNRYILS